MANEFNTVKNAPGVIAKAAAEILKEKIQFCKSVDDADKSDYEGKNGYKAGDEIQITIPPRFQPQDNFDITSSIQDVKEGKVPLALDITSTIGLEIDSLEDATEASVKQMINRVIEPAVQDIAEDVEYKMLKKATEATYNLVGTAGANTFDVDAILSGREKINKFLSPKDDKRFFLHDSTAGRKAVGARKGLFQDAAEIKKQYKQGYVGTADGFNWMENELLHVHTNGNDVTGVAMNGAGGEGGSTITVDGLTTSSGTVKKGTVFTIAGVFAVHPKLRTTYPFLQQFVVTADATADGSGGATLSISPSLYSAASGSLQNVSALPADNAALTFVGGADTSYTQNLAYHGSAFRKVSVPLMMPKKAEFAAQETVDGITVAIIRDFDVLQRRMITRLDFLGGLAAVRPEHACRITA